MTNKNSNLKTKTLLFASSFLILSFLASCSDSKNDDNKSDSTPVQVMEGSKIEVSKNENALEQKVQTKDTNRSKNDAFYYDYGDKSAQPENREASKPRTAIDANMNVRSPYEEVQISLIVNKLSKKFIVKCSACHNDYANGIIGPSLLGRDSNYIYGKIQAFKNGEKKNVLMTDLINMMNDKEIRDMADEIYKFNQEIKKIRDK